MAAENDIRWGEWLHMAYLHLGIKPTEFWQLTPMEFMLMLKPPGHLSGEVTRGELDSMREKFPD